MMLTTGQTLSSTHSPHLSKSHTIILFLKPEIINEIITNALPNIKKLLPASCPASPGPTPKLISYSVSQIQASGKHIYNTFRKCIIFYFIVSSPQLPQYQSPGHLTPTTTVPQHHCSHHCPPPIHLTVAF